jgi:hypothetical protein
MKTVRGRAYNVTHTLMRLASIVRESFLICRSVYHPSSVDDPGDHHPHRN